MVFTICCPFHTLLIILLHHFDLYYRENTYIDLPATTFKYEILHHTQHANCCSIHNLMYTYGHLQK